MTPKEYAARHRIPLSTVQRWLKRELIPGVIRHGRTYIIPDDAPRIYLKPGLKVGQKIHRPRKGSTA